MACRFVTCGHFEVVIKFCGIRIEMSATVHNTRVRVTKRTDATFVALFRILFCLSKTQKCRIWQLVNVRLRCWCDVFNHWRQSHAAHKCFSLNYKDFCEKTATMYRIFVANDVLRYLLRGVMSFKTNFLSPSVNCNCVVLIMFILYYLAGTVLSQGIAATNTGL